MINIILSVLCGIIVGFAIGLFIQKKHIIGNLRIGNSDEEPYLFLEIDSTKGSLYSIERSKYATFKVVVKNYISQK